jgi:hypothetical protein
MNEAYKIEGDLKSMPKIFVGKHEGMRILGSINKRVTLK